MYKIFINNNPLHFVKTLDNIDIEKNNHIFNYEPRSYVKQIISYLETKIATETDSYYFYSENIQDSQKHFLSFYQYIEAAGGVVKNKKGEILFIYRNDRWDLPKGKLEKNETTESAAIREVEEECGLKELKIIKELTSTYHTYFLQEKRILKRTYWFEMFYDGTENPQPQREEGITETKWMNKEEIEEVANKNTYNAIKEVINNVLY